MQAIDLTVADGTRIAARLYVADHVSPRAVVLIGGAMGVKAEFYAPFAEWLAAQRLLVATFDYRGMGDSRPAAPCLRGFDANLFDWAHDTDATIAALLARVPAGTPLYVIGHSLGAQLTGMLEHRDRIAGLVSVAAGSGYWRDNAPQLKRIVLYFWHVLVPLATALFGYFPGRRIGKMGDLPRGVVQQWRRWCMNPRDHVGAEGAPLAEKFAGARFPVVALSITDDELMTQRGTRVPVDLYAKAPRRNERIAPADVAARRIGHFGFFRRRFAPTLWTRMLALLQPQGTSA